MMFIEPVMLCRIRRDGTRGPVGGPGGSRVVKRRTPILLANDETRGARVSEKRREQTQERSGRVMRDERSFISSAGAGGFLLARLELRTTLVSF